MRSILLSPTRAEFLGVRLVTLRVPFRHVVGGFGPTFEVHEDDVPRVRAALAEAGWNLHPDDVRDVPAAAPVLGAAALARLEHLLGTNVVFLQDYSEGRGPSGRADENAKRCGQAARDVLEAWQLVLKYHSGAAVAAPFSPTTDAPAGALNPEARR